jgi:hypothetical protein
MRDREIDLISALVEGTLEDETEARAMLAASPELQAEYEAQRLAYEALSSAGSATMRDDEKAALHRDVWTALRSEPAAPRVRAPWYYRWVPVGVGVFVVGIAAVTVLTQTSGGDGAATFDEAAAETTIATSAEAGEMSAGTAAEDAATDTTAAAMAMAPETEMFGAAARSLREDRVDGTTEVPSATESAIALDECLDQAGLQDVDVIQIIDSAFLSEISGITVPTEDESRSFLVAVPAQEDPETAPIFFVDSDTCDIAYVDE